MDRNVRAHGESESESEAMIRKEMMTGIQGIQGTTRIEVEDLTEGGTSIVAIAAVEIKIMTG